MFACSPNAHAQSGYPGGGGGYPGAHGTYVWSKPASQSNTASQSPIYSGGKCVVNNGSGTTTYPYTGTTTWGGGNDAYPNGKAVSFTCSGPITATFTWKPDPSNPNEPPPDSVLVEQDCSVKCYLSGGTGSYATGLGRSGSGDGYLSDTLYSVKTNPGTSFSITPACSPSITATSKTTDGGCGATISYSATAAYVLNLSGGIGPTTAKSLLIGQLLTASLSTGALTQSGWNWTVSGGSPFKDYVATNSGAVYTPFSPRTTASMNCYFAKPDTPTVSCTAHLAVPPGTFPTAGLTVTTTQTLTTVKPNASLSIIIGSVNTEPGYPSNPTFVQLQRFPQTQPVNDDETTYASGITFSGTITTPSAYVLGSDYGSWNWTQLMTASRQEKYNGAYWKLALTTTSPPTIINNLKLLDGGYPYSGWYPANGVPTGNSDSPSQGLDPSPAIREHDVSDNFDDYLMYQPPGTKSLPVPLKETDWYWTFQALKNAANVWSTSGNNAYWGYVADFPDFPLWPLYAPDGCFTYAP